MATPSIPQASALLVLLLATACATPHPVSPVVWGHDNPRLRLVDVSYPPSLPTNSQPPRVGWIYRIEGKLNGQPVQYVGSAADLKRRLTNEHEWAKLLQRSSTKVYALEVFAELDVQASNRQTPLSARNEALRAAEQRALDQARARAHLQRRSNRTAPHDLIGRVP
jgi:hypothetical protein